MRKNANSPEQLKCLSKCNSLEKCEYFIGSLDIPLFGYTNVLKWKTCRYQTNPTPPALPYVLSDSDLKSSLCKSWCCLESSSTGMGIATVKCQKTLLYRRGQSERGRSQRGQRGLLDSMSGSLNHFKSAIPKQ